MFVECFELSGILDVVLVFFRIVGFEISVLIKSTVVCGSLLLKERLFVIFLCIINFCRE